MRTDLKIGDLITKAGIYSNPGVVTKKNEDGSVSVDTRAEIIDKYHRHTNTSGLSEEDKNRFNEIIDAMQDLSPLEQIEKLQDKIDNLKLNTENKYLVQYLRNQQAHLVAKSKQLPRTYNIDSKKILL